MGGQKHSNKTKLYLWPCSLFYGDDICNFIRGCNTLWINISIPTINTQLHLQAIFKGRNLLLSHSYTTNSGTSTKAVLTKTYTHIHSFLYHRWQKHNFYFPISQIHLFFWLGHFIFSHFVKYGKKMLAVFQNINCF